MSFGLSEAWASVAPASASTAPAEGPFSMVMILAIFVLFYFMLIRPQNKRAKDHRALMAKLQKGDEIVTGSGFLCQIVSLHDDYLKVNLAEGMEVYLQRQSVSAVLPKGTIKAL